MRSGSAIATSAAALAIAFFALFGGAQAVASEHLVITGEYGKEGPAASGIGNGCRLAYNAATQDLYLFSDGKVYGLSVTPGSATPLGGNFPFSTGTSTGCGDPDFEVDHSGSGRLYATPSTYSLYGWTSAGTALGSPWPISLTGETCGVAVTASGEVWTGNYSDEEVDKFSAAGASLGSIKTGFSVCKLAVDNSTGDLYAVQYGGGQIVKFTAASGYTTKVNFPSDGDGNAGVAVNGLEHKLYVGNNSSEVHVYDTETGSLVETIELGQSGGRGLAVDEGTDTLFVTVGSGESGVIREYLGLKTPKATTGEPIGNSKVSGIADPNEVGPITECYFQYGTTTAYGSKQDCEQALPISSEEEVTAELPGLIGEETYHYRLVLANGEPYVIGRGADRTIVPHNVKGLITAPATEITQESALLNANFEGTGEDTHYYFEWGQTTAYGHRTAVPPGDDAGVTTGPTHISTEVSGLEPGITYHYRVVGENSIGISKANDRTFKTNELPSIESFTSSHLSATSAEIDAKINPHEFKTEFFVEYGQTVDYGSVAPIPNGVLEPSNSPQDVAVPLTGLQGVTYHFRVVAESKWGRVVTEDQSFNFFPPVCPNSTVREQTGGQYLPDCRAYELVSPEETGNVELTNAPATVGPYATTPARFAFEGFLGGVKGTEPTNALGSDAYVATRTNSGWKTHLVGLRGYEGTAAGVLFPNTDFSRFLDFRENGGFEGEPQPPHAIPYVWDVEGNLLERWPENFESIPGSEETEGAFQPSPDLSHLAFSSTNVAYTSDGLTTGAGSAYDYDTATGTTTLISKTPGGDIELEPGNPGAPVGIFFPGGFLQFRGQDLTSEKPKTIYPPISTDGSHILMSTSSGPIGFFTHPLPPTRLYMSVDDAITYEVSGGKDVRYVGMTPDGTRVFFTSPEQLTGEDTDNSVDLYMWSEEGDRLTLISKGGEGAEGSGNSDECSASWISGCGIAPVMGNAETDNSIAADSGEVYFYSPEQLDGSKGLAGQENLYVYREGRPQFVTALSPIGGEAGPVTRMQVSPSGDHMAFVTASRVTSYNNAGKEEMYSYDPAARKVVCVSCRPDGEPPLVDIEASKMGLFMSNNGRTFFSTEDPLVPTDTNAQQDVYEYVEGRPQLITTGTGTSQSKRGGFGGSGNKGQEGLAGVSADGINVYFSSRDVLVPQNHNGPFLAFYDARTDGGFPYEHPLAPCEAADECHGEGNAAPVPPTVSSEGNLGSRGNAPSPRHRARHNKRHHKRHHRRSHRHGKRHLRQRSGNA